MKLISIRGAIPANKTGPAYIALPAPTLSALSLTTTQIKLIGSYTPGPPLFTYSFQILLNGIWTPLATQASPNSAATGLQPATTYQFRVNIQTGESPSRTSAWSAIASATTASASSLLSFIKTLGSGGPGYLSGQSLDWYSGTPLTVFNRTTPTFAGIEATGVVQFGGGNTNLLPCIIDICIAQSGGGNAINDVGATQPNIAFNAAPNDDWSLAQYFNSRGYLVKIDWQPVSPLLNANPWATIFTPGSSANTTLNSWIDALSTHCLTSLATTPFLFCIGIEENISASSYTNSNFYRIGLATSAQSAQLWQYVITRMIANGVKNALFCFETNSGLGNYLHGYPGDAYIDLMCFDYGPYTYNDTNMYAAISTSQSGGANALAAGITSAGNKPIYCGSLVANINGSQTANTVPNYTAQQDTIASYPRTFGAVIWGQTDALSFQEQAALCMSGAQGSSQWLDHTKLPTFTSAGGIGGG